MDNTYSDVSSAGRNFSADQASRQLKQDDVRLPGGSGCLLKCKRTRCVEGNGMVVRDWRREIIGERHGMA